VVEDEDAFLVHTVIGELALVKVFFRRFFSFDIIASTFLSMNH